MCIWSLVERELQCLGTSLFDGRGTKMDQYPRYGGVELSLLRMDS